MAAAEAATNAKSKQRTLPSMVEQNGDGPTDDREEREHNTIEEGGEVTG